MYYLNEIYLNLERYKKDGYVQYWELNHIREDRYIFHHGKDPHWSSVVQKKDLQKKFLHIDEFRKLHPEEFI